MKTIQANFEIPLQLFFMTHTVQFCTLQMGIFFFKCLQKIKKRFQSKIAWTELERKWY